MDASQHYRIGKIAERTGVSVETLRYYEKRGLLNAPARTQGGYRVYSNAVLHQVKFIKQAQSLGLTLDDIQRLATGRMRTNHAPSCRKVRDLLTTRIEDIDARIAELREFRHTLHVFSDGGRKLPNGWIFGLPTELYLTSSGKSFDGRGVPPDIRVPVFPAVDLARGRDGALERAIKVLAKR
jgi:MerR family Zn(II)-responsive transcriptional regulator of zntA